MNLGLAGKYTIYKQKVAMKDGIPLLDENGNQVLLGEQEKVAEFENLITNNGLDLIGKKASCNYMIVSSDNTVPSITDTAINILGITQSAGTGDGNVNKNVTTAPYWVSYQCVKRFGAGVGTGNIAKIAISNNSTGTDLFSIALVKDINGNPTTITKLADEILDVSYQLRTYLDDSDTTSTITISGNTHTVTARACAIASKTAPWVSSIANIYKVRIGSAPMVSAMGIPSALTDASFNNAAYTLGSYKLNVNISQLPINTHNFTNGISLIHTLETGNVAAYSNNATFQFGISPPIMKTSTQTLTLPPITLSWGRYEGEL